MDAQERNDQTRPAYPDVQVKEPPLSQYEHILLIGSVGAALARAGVPVREVELFVDEASSFSSYGNMLATARHWVTIIPREATP